MINDGSSRSPMMTPLISDEYLYQLKLKGRRLPVTFTVPDMPDTPSSAEQFDPGPSSDKDTGFEETNVLLDVDRIEVDVDIDRPSLPPVSAHPLCARATEQRMSRNWVLLLTTRQFVEKV